MTMNAFDILWQYRQAFFDGFVVTCELVILTAAGGSIAGITLEWACTQLGGHLRRGVDAVAFCVSAIPALVILFWFHYPAQALVGVVVPPFWTALTTLLIINIFAVYRIIADAVRDFPKQYVAIGMVCGLKRTHIIRYIQLPLLLRSAFPRWIDQQVVILQTSVFASLIGVEETFRVAQRINSVVYHPVVIYTSMALIFLATAGGGMYCAQILRSKFHRDLSER